MLTSAMFEGSQCGFCQLVKDTVHSVSAVFTACDRYDAQPQMLSDNVILSVRRI